MTRFSPALLERAVSVLRKRESGLSSSELVREVLGIESAEEELARRLIAPLLENDERFVHEEGRWRFAPRDVDDSPTLAGPFLAVFAPVHVGLTGCHHQGEGRAAVTVSLEGSDELARARVRGLDVKGEAFALLDAARLLRAYAGPPLPRAVAEAFGAELVEEGDDIDVQARLVAAAYAALVDELALEGVTTRAGLEALLDHALAETDFSGRAFGRAEIENLDEGPGVYVFRDAAGSPLYVGQSLSLRARVASYFAGPPRDVKDRAIRARAHLLEVETCDTGPDALIREAQRIARLAPELNTQRKVERPPRRSGVLVVRDPRHEERAVLFAMESGRLVARGIARGLGARALASVDRVLAAWREARSGEARGDEHAARLLATWCAAHPRTPFFELGLHGGDDAIRAAILAVLQPEKGTC